MLPVLFFFFFFPVLHPGASAPVVVKNESPILLLPSLCYNWVGTCAHRNSGKAAEMRRREAEERAAAEAEAALLRKEEEQVKRWNESILAKRAEEARLRELQRQKEKKVWRLAARAILARLSVLPFFRGDFGVGLGREILVFRWFSLHFVKKRARNIRLGQCQNEIVTEFYCLPHDDFTGARTWAMGHCLDTRGLMNVCVWCIMWHVCPGWVLDTPL